MKKIIVVLLFALAIIAPAVFAAETYQCTLNNQQVQMVFYSQGSVFSPWTESGSVDVYINDTKYQTYRYDATDTVVLIEILGTFYKVDNKLILPVVTLNGL